MADECQDDIVREGVAAYLAETLEQSQARASQRSRHGWTAGQFAEEQLLEQLRGLADQLAPYQDRHHRQAVLQRFHQYAYQWY
ncbi:MAG: hypothetical protein ACYC0X_09885 [Pirellulaceae bacterium]